MFHVSQLCVAGEHEGQRVEGGTESGGVRGRDRLHMMTYMKLSGIIIITTLVVGN